MSKINEAPRIDPEFAALMPPLTKEEYDQLTQNIVSQKKCFDAVLMWDGIIVDGVNRFCVCLEHKIEFKVEEMQFSSREDAKVWIIENQLGRRNLCDAARIELALCRAELLREKAQENLKRGRMLGGMAGKDENKSLPKTTKLNPDEAVNIEEAVAKEAGVGKGTLYRYEQIKASGNAELLQKVQSGEMKIGTAHRLLPKSIEKQMKEADKSLEYIKIRLPYFEDGEMKTLIQNRMNELAIQLRALIAKYEGAQNIAE